MFPVSPMIAVNGSEEIPAMAVKFIAGASGSMRIMAATTYVATRVLLFGETVKEVNNNFVLKDQVLISNATKILTGCRCWTVIR